MLHASNMTWLLLEVHVLYKPCQIVNIGNAIHVQFRGVRRWSNLRLRNLTLKSSHTNSRSWARLCTEVQNKNYQYMHQNKTHRFQHKRAQAINIVCEIKGATLEIIHKRWNDDFTCQNWGCSSFSVTRYNSKELKICQDQTQCSQIFLLFYEPCLLKSTNQGFQFPIYSIVTV